MHIVCFITVPTPDEASRIARALVEEGLAACVNVVSGVHSVYRWSGAVEESDEVLLMVKTTGAAFERLRDRVLALHSYEVPEVIAVPVERGHLDYLGWITESVRSATADR